jgi:geranyl-CoA carboxylase alpha subunit
MRLVNEPSALGAAIESARSEASHAFGDGELIVERAILGARHVEVQVFADAHGNAIHLGERDCSIQRRHQKVIEESPSPAVSPELRQRMGDIAVTAARAIAYQGAGTLEFLLAPNGEFYFMEMNTRLQVEHPVTEMVTGLDLVEWQLRVADGEPLPRRQEEITFSGCAVEARLCAEDPAAGYLPQTGTVLAWSPPSGEGIRVDHAIRTGQAISPFYDAMQAKIVASGPDRETARRRLMTAIADHPLLGVTTNAALLLYAVGHTQFQSGGYDTRFLEEHADDNVRQRLFTPSQSDIALGAALMVHDDGLRLAALAGFERSLVGWSSAHADPIPVTLEVREKQVVTVRALRTRAYEVHVGGTRFEIADLDFSEGVVAYATGGARRRAYGARVGNTLWLSHGGRICRLVDKTWTPEAKEATAASGRVCTPMNGRVVRVAVRPGEAVRAGDVVVVVEAMKMEIALPAEIHGVVADVNVAPGQQVTAERCLVRIEGGSEFEFRKFASEAPGGKKNSTSLP